MIKQVLGSDLEQLPKGLNDGCNQNKEAWSKDLQMKEFNPDMSVYPKMKMEVILKKLCL